MKAEIAKIIYALGEYYDKKLTATQIHMYTNDLICLTPSELQRAIEEYRIDPANVFFPLPSKLIGLIRPVESELDIGRVVAARIITATSKCGHNNIEGARKFIGELGWEVVKLQGGWKALCELTTEDLKAEQPRLRDLAVSLSKRSKLGRLNDAPALPAPNANEVTKLISETMKLR